MVKFPRRKSAQTPATTTSTAGTEEPTPNRFKQIAMVAGIIRKSDPKALPIVIGSGIGIIVVFVVVGLLVGIGRFLIPFGVLGGVATAMFLFGRYAQSAQYAAIAGQPGAAAAIVQSMRGNWTVTPAIAGNRNMDIVHRVVGRPGVILIGEGAPNGLASLMSAEKKRISRIAYGVPITELQVGDEKGQIPIKQLQNKLMRLPKDLKPGAVTDLNTRLKAMPSSLQPPRGPMPRAGRMPKQPRPKVR
ncbi:MAG TPA: DUF4191 domain-containing protein [Streptosporangiaceae bacterium]|jgi:hypothetical protein|nr:DUF4191 domain-containing protein [Streptosporangiaceae bacterium]